MSEATTYFNDFLTNISPTQPMIDAIIAAHTEIRQKLQQDTRFKDEISYIFLQGSYIRKTLVRPLGENDPLDVDVVVVTNLDKDEYIPASKVFDHFEPFFTEHYPGRYRRQHRSFGVTFDTVKVDVVFTSAPSESMKRMVEAMSSFNQDILQDYRDEPMNRSNPNRIEDVWKVYKSRAIAANREMFGEKVADDNWKKEPLWIPDRETSQWSATYPIAQIEWTVEKNKACNGNYTRVVRAIKWWWKVMHPEQKHPKGYPLEHIIGQNCRDAIAGVASGLLNSFENIVANYAAHVKSKTKPFLPDHGVPQHDVLERLTPEEFEKFYLKVNNAAILARKAYNSDDHSESVALWKQLLGSKFPDPPKKNSSSSDTSGGAATGGFTARTQVTEPKEPTRYA